MSFESISQELPPDFEKEGIEEKSIESLSGPLPELLRMHYNSEQLDVLTREIFDIHGVSLDAINRVDLSANEVVSLCEDFFSAEDPTAKNLIADKIAQTIRNA